MVFGGEPVVARWLDLSDDGVGVFPGAVECFLSGLGGYALRGRVTENNGAILLTAIRSLTIECGRDRARPKKY